MALLVRYPSIPGLFLLSVYFLCLLCVLLSIFTGLGWICTAFNRVWMAYTMSLRLLSDQRNMQRLLFVLHARRGDTLRYSRRGEKYTQGGKRETMSDDVGG